MAACSDGGFLPTPLFLNHSCNPRNINLSSSSFLTHPLSAFPHFQNEYPSPSLFAHSRGPKPPSIWGAAMSLVQEETVNMAVNSDSHSRKPKSAEVSPLRDRIVTLNSIRACARKNDLHMACRIHDHVLQTGLIREDVYISNALITMYVKFGLLEKAQAVFDDIPVRDVVSWNALITGYVQHGRSNEAIEFFGRMPKEGLSPNSITLTYVLKACSSIGSAKKAEEMHAGLQKQGLLTKNRKVQTALLDMYAKCGAMEKAQGVFDELIGRDVVSWNALVAAYAQHGLGDEALKCFFQMQEEGIPPDSISFACAAKACSIVESSRKGEEIHAMVSRFHLLGKDTVIANALVHVYAKCGLFEKAHEILDELPARDVIAWTAIIDGYVQHDLGDKALSCLETMQEQGVSPNAVTFTCILKACGSVGSPGKGEEIHVEIKKQGLLKKNAILGTALIDMYAKCCEIDKAQKAFDELLIKDVVAWTALISGYSQLGNIKRVSMLFNQMIAESVIPSAITFVVLLTACNHAGLVEDGQIHFDTMKTVYYIDPTIEHYNCMVDLFSRAGHFDKAMDLIEKVPALDRLQLWMSLLSGCRKWVNVEVGRWAFQHLMEMDAKLAPAYVSMHQIYVAAGMPEEACRIKDRVWEIQGCFRWFDVD